MDEQSKSDSIDVLGLDRQAFNEVLAQVYSDLAKQAHFLLNNERPGNMLQTCALVHEAYIRLLKTQQLRWQDTQHFKAIFTQVMRRALIDHVRLCLAQKRGAGNNRVTLNDNMPLTSSHQNTNDVETLKQALQRLSTHDPIAAEIVKLRFFSELSIDVIAQELNTSEATIKRKWSYAKTVLYRDLQSAAA